MVTENKVPLTESQDSLDGKVGNYGDYYQRELKITAILQVTGGWVLAALGIVALYLTAWWSYYCSPIWIGIVIYGVTGALGIYIATDYYYNYYRIKWFVGLSLFGALMACSIVGLYIYVATEEDNGYWLYNQGTWIHVPACEPGANSFIIDCDVPAGARQAIDGLIVAIGCFLLGTCLSSATYGFYILNASLRTPFQKMKISGNAAFIVASPDGSIRLLTGAMDLKGEQGKQVLREATVVYCMPVMGAHSLPAAAPPYSLPSDDDKTLLTPSIPDPDPQG